MKTETELRELYNAGLDRLDKLIERMKSASDDEIATIKEEFDVAQSDVSVLKAELEHVQGLNKAKSKFKKYPLPEGGIARVSVDEPDMYGPGGRSFMVDLYSAQIKGDPSAQDRIARHHIYETERYAVSTSTLGGVIPPQYLVGLYAKAQRFGRVFADQCRREPLPDQGMSLIVPRLTAGTTAAIQASEGATVATQDPTEADLTVNVRTIAGYSPVSRQTLERAAYSEAILFEDLVARYFATLDTQLLSGSGSSGQHLGVLNVSGISTATVSSWTAANAWAAIVGENGILSAINQWATTVGAPADKLIMHPRRWGAFLGLLDTQNRPLVVPDTGSGTSFNAMATGEAAGYGMVGRLGGVPVYTDANIPTNLGGGTNEDRIIAIASQAVILWERDEDPVTLAFEQQAGNALTVELVCFGYSAFTAGRFPAATGVISGAGLT